MFSFFNEDQLALRYGGSETIVDLQSGSGEVFDLDSDPKEERDISTHPDHKKEFARRVNQLRLWKSEQIYRCCIEEAFGRAPTA